MKLVPYQPNPQERQITPVEVSQTTLSGIPVSMNSMYGKPQASMDLFTYIDVLRRRWMWIVGAMAVVLALGVVNTKLTKPEYAATTEIVIKDRLYEGHNGSKLDSVEDYKNNSPTRSITAQIRLLQSQEVIEAARASMSTPLQTKQITGVQVDNPKELGDPIAVTVNSEDAKAAAEMANRLVDELIKRDLAERQKNATAALKFVEQELERVGNELQVARQQLAESKVTNQTTGSAELLNDNITELNDLKTQLDGAQRDLAVANSRLISLRTRLAKERPEKATDITELPNPDVERVDEKINALETERREKLAIYTVDAPEIRNIERQIRELQDYRRTLKPTKAGAVVSSVNPLYQRLQEEYNNALTDVATLQTKVSALRQSIGAKTGQLSTQTPASVKAAQLENTVKVKEDRYAELSGEYQTLRIDEAAQVSNISVLNQARENPYPVSPNLTKNLILATALGILLSIIITVTLEAMDHRIHSERSMQTVTMRPALAQIPRVAALHGAHLPALPADSSGPLLEQMRILRNNLATYLQDDRRILAVTSPGVGEGKSTTSLNLAVTMSLDGKRVVLIDADLRSPSLHNYLGLKNEKGVSNIYSGNVTLEQALVTTPIAGVTFLPAGPPVVNSPEILHSEIVHGMIRTLADQFDVVIVDTPPAVGLSDVLSLTPVVDGFLIVVSATRTHRDDLRLTTQLLEQSGAPVLGFVYNQASMSRQIYRNYYHYQEKSGGITPTT